MVIVGVQSNRGVVKAVNQDACCYLEAASPLGRVSMAIMCDGVGGLSKGELASATVVHRFSEWFSNHLPTFISYNAQSPDIMQSLGNVWNTLLQTASENIYEYGRREATTLGTTFTGMIVIGGRYLIGHVGDCRAYRVTDAGVAQLTSDQTLVAQQVAAGILTPEEAANHPKRNVILQSVGTQANVEPQFIIGDYDASSTYLFCCDGFYSKLRQADFRLFTPSMATSEAALQDACTHLVGQVLERGEKDNVTVLAFTEVEGEAAWQSGAGSGPYGAFDIDDENSPTDVGLDGAPYAGGFAAGAAGAADAVPGSYTDDATMPGGGFSADDDSLTMVGMGGDA